MHLGNREVFATANWEGIPHFSFYLLPLNGVINSLFLYFVWCYGSNKFLISTRLWSEREAASYFRWLLLSTMFHQDKIYVFFAIDAMVSNNGRGKIDAQRAIESKGQVGLPKRMNFRKNSKQPNDLPLIFGKLYCNYFWKRPKKALTKCPKSTI